MSELKIFIIICFIIFCFKMQEAMDSVAERKKPYMQECMSNGLSDKSLTQMEKIFQIC